MIKFFKAIMLQNYGWKLQMQANYSTTSFDLNSELYHYVQLQYKLKEF